MTKLTSDILTVCDLGRMDFAEAWDVQRKVHTTVKHGRSGPVILIVEHPYVLTLGRNCDGRNVVASNEQLAEWNAEVVSIDRGGDVTAHMPGQLVAYPIMKLDSRLGPKAYVMGLEDTVIRTLAAYDIFAGRDAINAGVWVEKSKICAVGIRIAERVTMHGIALNVSNDLGFFDLIVPCGITNRTVTSMEKILGRDLDLENVKETFITAFLDEFGFLSRIDAPQSSLLA